MKRSIVFICFILLFFSISASEIMHAYWGDYIEIVRIVFVARTGVHYNTLIDTDNRVIQIHINDARLGNAILPIDFTATPLINHVVYEPINRDLRITIFSDIVFYAESFFLIEENFKIVVDVYRQRDPSTLEQAMHYLHFYETVGFHDRAIRLRRRIQNNEFMTPVPLSTSDIPPPPPPPPTQPREQQQQTSIQSPMQDHLESRPFQHENLLLYLRPDATHLNANQQNWINESFRIYDIFINLHLNLDLVERTLELYDTQRTIDITFIDTMSLSSNILSDANIKINEIRLQMQNAWNRRPQTNEAQIRYTEEMIQHVLSVLNSYHARVNRLQREYEMRVRI